MNEYTVIARPSYIRRDGTASKRPQNWIGIVTQTGVTIRVVEGCGTKSQALRLASVYVSLMQAIEQ